MALPWLWRSREIRRRRSDVGDRGIERYPLLDGALQRLVNRLGQAFALHGFAEDVDAEDVLDGLVLEIDVLQFVGGAGDRLDGGVPRVRGTHTGFLTRNGDGDDRASAAPRRDPNGDVFGEASPVGEAPESILAIVPDNGGEYP